MADSARGLYEIHISECGSSKRAIIIPAALVNTYEVVTLYTNSSSATKISSQALLKHIQAEFNAKENEISYIHTHRSGCHAELSQRSYNQGYHLLTPASEPLRLEVHIQHAQSSRPRRIRSRSAVEPKRFKPIQAFDPRQSLRRHRSAPI